MTGADRSVGETGTGVKVGEPSGVRVAVAVGIGVAAAPVAVVATIAGGGVEASASSPPIRHP